MLMRLMSKGEYLIIPKGTKFKGSGKLGLTGFSGSVILRYQPLMFPIPIVLDLTGWTKINFVWGGECLKISQIFFAGDIRHISKVCEKKKKTI